MRRSFPATHDVIKWPLFISSCCFAMILAILYFFVRTLVACFERLLEPSYITFMRERLLQSRTYEEYVKQARKLDTFSGVNEWKRIADSPFYNAGLIKKNLADLVKAIESFDFDNILKCVELCLNERNWGGVFNEALYSQCWDGSKQLVEDYINTLVTAIYTLGRSIKGVERIQRDPFKHILEGEIFGKTALCLSGGGSICLQHLGVIKALLQRGILPDILCGTSGGSVICAFIATRSTAEVERDFHVPKFKSLVSAFKEPWTARLKRLYQLGEMFDVDHTYELLGEWCMGDLTFSEAYKKTGRILNVTVTPHGARADSGVILNYITAPHVIIRSAVLSSSAFPTFFRPRPLKEKIGGRVQECELLKFSDGSLVTDIPKDKLYASWGVRFCIVSQVNPHITPFFFNIKGEAGNPIIWRWGKTASFRGGFVLSALEVLIKAQIKTLFRVIRELEIGPTVGGSPWVSVFIQNFTGDLTLTNNRYYLYKLSKGLSDPSSLEELEWWIHEGELMAWPKIAAIAARMRIENALKNLCK